MIDIEKAQRILNFLPIRRQIEEEKYIDHLWSTFTVLNECDNSASPFMIMPYHLIFMLSIQYMILRISKLLNRDYGIAFVMKSIRDDQKSLHNPSFPFDIANLNESEIIDLLKLINFPPENCKVIKNLIRNRNDNLAHAKGGIESDVEKRIEEYLDALYKIQKHLENLNKNILGLWLSELDSEDVIDEFIERRLLDSYLSPYDFIDILLPFLESQKVIDDQFEELINKAINFDEEKTIEIVKHIAKSSSTRAKRHDAVYQLMILGYLDEEFREEIKKCEHDQDILEMLMS